MSTRRALHFVFKVGNRTETAKFYRDVLGMKFLRHEEFEKGCEAACNGPYDGKWSKSMVGYGPEDKHFVVELTYNYGIGTYRLGTDFRGINISSKEMFKKVSNCGDAVAVAGGKQEVKSPDGYSFIVEDRDCPGDPVQSVCLGCSDLSKSVDFWSRLCGMKIYRQENKSALLGFDDNQCKLELQDIGTDVDHATAFGRIAFSCPRTELPDIEKKMKEAEQTILTPLISLDTPGKATVEVVILADPDGHEICFIGDEAFRELSQVDDKADKLLDQGVAADKSDEWFKKKGLTKGTA